MFSQVVHLGRRTDTHDAQIALFFRSDELTGVEEMAKRLAMVESADVPDGELFWIGPGGELQQFRNVKVDRKAIHSIFFAIEIAHAPTGDVNTLYAPQQVRESAAQQRLEHAIAF